MDDYEEANAREWDLYYKENKQPQQSSATWQVVQSAKGKGKQPERRAPVPQQQRTAFVAKNTGPRKKKVQTPHRLPPNLVVDVDNDAEISWRNHEPAKDTIRIPADLCLQDRGYENIVRFHNAFIQSTDPRPTNGHIAFDLWGDDTNVASAKSGIIRWIESAMTPSKRSRNPSKFAKIASMTPQQRRHAEKSWKRESNRQRFRQQPMPGELFMAIGSFHWPVAEYQPENVLGTSLEALDPIRMDCSCYVLYNKEQSLLRVMGKDEQVEEGLRRIHRTCFQIAARQISPVRLSLLLWSDEGIVPTHVFLEPYAYPAQISGDRAAKAKMGLSPRGEGIAVDDATATIRTSRSKDIMRSAVMQTLKRLRFYCGNINMRVRLGTFLAIQRKEPCGGMYELNEYEDMIQDSGFRGLVTQELGNIPVERSALQALKSAANLLMPLDPTSDDLDDIEPVVSALFTFADTAGDLRLAVVWHKSKESSTRTPIFDLISRKWSRLERDIGTEASLIDVSLSDLDTGMAWHFEMQATQVVNETRLPPELVSFARSIRLDSRAAARQSMAKSLVTFPPHGSLKSFQQRISHRYGLQSTDYILEVSLFQDRTYTSRNGRSHISTGQATVYEPRWGLNVFSNVWDTMLAENERLAVGTVVDWPLDVDAWFPETMAGNLFAESTGKGFDDLIGKLNTIKDLVCVAGVQEEASQADLLMNDSSQV